MSHKNIISTYLECQITNNVYIIGELCEQCDLAPLVREQGR
jgi:hypothetical protein